MSTDLRLSIGSSLTAIPNLCSRLEDEAAHRFADKVMPGGDALVLLGPSANMEAFNYQQLSELMGRTDGGSGADELDSDPAPPLLVLASWSEIVATEMRTTRIERATIDREVAYLRKVLDWITGVNEDGEPYFLAAQELDRDLRKLVSSLEAVLHDGERAERTEVRCINDEQCDEKPKLVRKYEDDIADDHWVCPRCRARYDHDEYLRAFSIHKHSEAAGKAWIKVSDAAHSISRPIQTLRTWIAAEKISTQITPGPPTTIYVLWADVREADQNARVIDIRRKFKKVAS